MLKNSILKKVWGGAQALPGLYVGPPLSTRWNKWLDCSKMISTISDIECSPNNDGKKMFSFFVMDQNATPILSYIIHNIHVYCNWHFSWYISEQNKNTPTTRYRFGWFPHDTDDPKVMGLLGCSGQVIWNKIKTPHSSGLQIHDINVLLSPTNEILACRMLMTKDWKICYHIRYGGLWLLHIEHEMGMWMKTLDQWKGYHNSWHCFLSNLLRTCLQHCLILYYCRFARWHDMSLQCAQVAHICHIYVAWQRRFSFIERNLLLLLQKDLWHYALVADPQYVVN